MTNPPNIASFMLRFTQEMWRDMQGEPHIRWRGHIRHVQGDQPLGYLVDLHGHMQEHTQGDILLHCYTELAQHHGQMELTRDILLAQ